MKILLAEDDPNISKIAKIALESFGQHTVSLADNGELALEMALSNQYDLILLDEMMPKMNGISVCENYRAKGGTAPVIFMSANAQDSSILQFEKLASGFIPKPFDPTQLCQQIDTILDEKAAV